MLDTIKIDKILFLDIETVPAYPSLADAEELYKELWDKKSMYFRKEAQTAADVYERAGIYAEFGKIVCISFGMIALKSGVKKIKIKSIFGDDERKLLIEFSQLLEKISKENEIYLCAHNGKEFDFPYISRRMLVNGVKLPALLNVTARKPWETPFIDTLDLWKFGDHKHYTSLALLTFIFGIQSPKTDLDGSMVAKTYWVDKDLQRIARYCRNDVLAIAQLVLKFKGEDLIPTENIEMVDN